MFGLESDKKPPNKNKEYRYDLEKDIIKDAKRRREIEELAKLKIKQIKDIMRSGESQTEFDQFGLLLYGYEALIKVISRIKE